MKTSSATRSEIIARSTTTKLDAVVIGGGIHGAAIAAKLSALGYKSTLLEMAGFASGTSSRSSKMAHGGLRYLEMFDFQQVFEGIKARERLFEKAPNLVKPSRFLIPVPKGKWFFRIKLGIGLYLYDLFVNKRERKHRWIPRSKFSLRGFDAFHQELMGCYEYTDGIMNDARLVHEYLLAARLMGGNCLNYAKVTAVKPDDKGESSVTFQDLVTGDTHKIACRVIVNCAGPWVADLMPGAKSTSSLLKFSRGSHILFNVPWKSAALFLPLPEKGRYYFVWPHYSGTLVGTTEREVETLDQDPQPTPDEIEEIMDRVQKDIPNAGLNSKTAHYAFAGVRTLPLRTGKKKVSGLSRKHIWSKTNGMFSLLGGKFTTFEWTTEEGIRLITEFLGLDNKERTLQINLPSAVSPQNFDAEVTSIQAITDCSLDEAMRCVNRLGTMWRWYSDRPLAKKVSLDGVTGFEIYHAIFAEGCTSLTDLMRLHLDLEFLPEHGIQSLKAIRDIVDDSASSRQFDWNLSTYLERVNNIRVMLNRPPVYEIDEADVKAPNSSPTMSCDQ